MTSLQLQYYRDLEEKRHNIVLEEETIRHNKEQEVIGYRQAAAALTQANAAQRQASIAGARAAIEATNAIFTRQKLAAESRQASANTALLNANTLLAQAKTATESYNAYYTYQKGREQEASANAAARYASWSAYYSMMKNKAAIEQNPSIIFRNYASGGADIAKGVSAGVNTVASLITMLAG